MFQNAAICVCTGGSSSGVSDAWAYRMELNILLCGTTTAIQLAQRNGLY